MAGLNEIAKWEREVYQIEEDDPVLGGVEGVTNKPLKHLANRTLYLKQVLEGAGQKLMPKKLTATTRNTADSTGHTHEIDLASTTTKGLVQLTNDTGLDSEVLALTAKAGKAIAQSVAQLQVNTNNALNQKVNKTDISNAVNSTSQTTVASSQAVKTAYDLANSKYTAQDASPTRKGLVQLADNLTTNDATKALTAAQGVAIKERLDKFIISNNCQEDADTLVVDGIYSYGRGDMSNKNLPTNHNYYVQVISGDSPGWHRQIAMKAYSGDRYERYKVSLNGSWSPWKRIDFGGIFRRFDSGSINLDDFKNDGFFNIGAAINRPVLHSGMLFVLSGGTEGRNGTLQRYTLHNRQECYERWFDASTNTWSDWARVDAEWSALRNKPTTVDGFGITDAIKKTGDTMTGNLVINHAYSHVRGQRSGVDTWYVGNESAGNQNIILNSYVHNTSIKLKQDRVESNKPIYRGNHLVFDEGNLLPVRQVNLRANIGNTQTAYQDAAPEQLPEGSFVGLSTKAGLDGSMKYGWMMINKNWSDNTGAYSYNRLGIFGDRMFFQVARLPSAWGEVIELVTHKQFANLSSGYVRKSGDQMNSLEINQGHKITTSHYGAGSYASQYNVDAPFVVSQNASVARDTYHPFIKGKVRAPNQWGAAFSLGYTTNQSDQRANGPDGFGRGVVHLIEDNGTNCVWHFEHDGSFVSGDVATFAGKRLSNATMLSDFVYQKIGNFEIRKYPDGTMIQEHKWQQVDLHNWNVQTFHWAVAFVDTPSIYTQITTNVRGVHDAGINVLTTSNHTKVDYVLYEHASVNQGDCRIQFLAIGRWK